MNNQKQQVTTMKKVRKLTVFVGKTQGPPKGAKGYNRKRENQNWRKEI
jgi:hypothetical protein